MCTDAMIAIYLKDDEMKYKIKTINLDILRLTPKDCVGLIFKNKDGVYDIPTTIKDIQKSHRQFGNTPQQILLLSEDEPISTGDYFLNVHTNQISESYFDGWGGSNYMKIIAAFPKLHDLNIINFESLKCWVYHPTEEIEIESIINYTDSSMKSEYFIKDQSLRNKYLQERREKVDPEIKKEVDISYDLIEKIHSSAKDYVDIDSINLHRFNFSEALIKTFEVVSSTAFENGIKSDIAKEYWFNQFKNLFEYMYRNGISDQLTSDYRAKSEINDGFDKYFNILKSVICDGMD